MWLSRRVFANTYAIGKGTGSKCHFLDIDIYRPRYAFFNLNWEKIYSSRKTAKGLLNPLSSSHHSRGCWMTFTLHFPLLLSTSLHCFHILSILHLLPTTTAAPARLHLSQPSLCAKWRESCLGITIHLSRPDHRHHQRSRLSAPSEDVVDDGVWMLLAKFFPTERRQGKLNIGHVKCDMQIRAL